jgi:LysM repeat protein
MRWPLCLCALLFVPVGCVPPYPPPPPAGPPVPADPATGAAPAPAAHSAPVPAWRPPDSAHAAGYVIQPKDTLSEVAQRRLGSVRQVPLLLLTNPGLPDAHTITAGETLAVPGPGYFAAPFLVSGERAAACALLRWSEAERAGFLGVAVEDSGPAGLDRYLVLEVRGGRSRVVFSSADHPWRGAHCEGYRRGWDWEALDLDGDKGLDLVASISFGVGSGTTFCAYAFHAGPAGYTRHPVVEEAHHGGFAEGRRLFRDRAIEVRAVRETALPGGRVVQPVRILCRWTGAGFERREVELGRGSFERAAAPAPGPLK